MSVSLDKDKIKTYIISVLVPLVLGGLVGLVTSGSMRYDSLIQPPLAPPALLFPIAWTILYVLMGVSHGILKANRLSDNDTELVIVMTVCLYRRSKPAGLLQLPYTAWVLFATYLNLGVWILNR